jgi:uncharacterized protein DUF4231
MDAGVRQTESISASAGRVWARLEEQIAYYDRVSRHAKRWYQLLAALQILAAAAVPVGAAAGAPYWLLGSLGATVVVIQGLQLLFQYHANWLRYRAVCEELAAEAHLYAAGAGPYREPEFAGPKLAERIERIVEYTWFVGRTDVGPHDREPAPDPRGSGEKGDRERELLRSDAAWQLERQLTHSAAVPSGEAAGGVSMVTPATVAGFMAFLITYAAGAPRVAVLVFVGVFSAVIVGGFLLQMRVQTSRAATARRQDDIMAAALLAARLARAETHSRGHPEAGAPTLGELSPER